MRCRSSICESIGCDHQKLYVVKEFHSLRRRLSRKFSLAVARMFWALLERDIIAHRTHSVTHSSGTWTDYCSFEFVRAVLSLSIDPANPIKIGQNRFYDWENSKRYYQYMIDEYARAFSMKSHQPRFFELPAVTGWLDSVRPLYTTLAIQIQARNGWR